MAEIEFKRRGTPLWAVVLVLLVIAGALYALFGRKGGAPTPATADSAAVAPTTAPSATPGASTAPATPATPLAALGAWVDSAKVPTGDAGVAAYAGSGLQLVAAAMQEKVPMAGVQYVLVRAMADTVLMAGTPPKKQLDATQAAFFALAYAMRDKPAGATVQHAAERLGLTQSLGQQREDVQRFFRAARDAMTDPMKPATPPTPGVKAPSPPAPQKQL